MNTMQMYVFRFTRRENDYVIERTEEKELTSWGDAYLYFVSRCKELGIEYINSGSFATKG